MDKINELKDCVEKIAKESYKFFQRNNKASGVRARKRLQKCKKLAQEIRLMIQKSKQDQVQRKSAAAAAAAAVSGAGLLNEQIIEQASVSNSNFKGTQYNSYGENTNTHTHLANGENQDEFFYQERNLKENSSQSIDVFQNRTRLDDIPIWNNDRINLFN